MPSYVLVSAYEKILLKYSFICYTSSLTLSNKSCIWTLETLLLQPSCQLMIVNSCSSKGHHWLVLDCLDLLWSPKQKNVTRAAVDNSSAISFFFSFSQQMTPLGQNRLSFPHFSTRLGSVGIRPGCYTDVPGPLGASFSSSIEEWAG